jgi:hypothetical protein
VRNDYGELIKKTKRAFWENWLEEVEQGEYGRRTSL